MTSARNRANPKLDLSTERRDALSVKAHPAAGGRGWEFDPAFQWLMGLEEVNYHTLGCPGGEAAKLDELFTQLLGVLSA
jgi:hypothetical protein